jgi:eukaryotic-like serine/threonine-protein kinase
MNELLKPGQVVQSRSGQPCTVISFLGGGGQGEVYRARWGSGEFALKWYYQQSATPEQRESLEALIDEGSPSDRFLWPEDLADTRAAPGFGYIMRLRPPAYRKLTDFMCGRIQPTFATRTMMAIELTKAFRSLHTKGLCYRDISFGNAFFDPAGGNVLVCDNDNVATNRTKKGGVLGTPDFMAPEIVRGQAVPSNKTDLFSLAVLLFYIFHLGHPLVGSKILGIRCWDAAARQLLFGREPVFIFDPSDPSNAAVGLDTDPTGEAGGNALCYWRIYPRPLRDTFVKAFTVGIGDPDSRVTELEWLETLAVLRDSIFRCACGTPNFYDADTVKANGGRPGPCWSCGKEPKLPFRIRIGKAVVMLNSDAQLFGHHLLDGQAFDYSTPLAQVVQHPTNPGVWGLRNLGKAKWVATMANGSMQDVDPGRAAPLVTDLKISFGKHEGEIRY